MNRWQTMAAMVLVMSCASLAVAQLAEADIEGTLDKVAPLVVAVQTDTGDVYIASIDTNRTEGNTTYNGIPDPVVKVTGRVTRKFLRRGMIVRFAAIIEKKRLVADTITELTVIPSSPGMKLGILDREEVPEAKATEGQQVVIGRIGTIKADYMTLSFASGSTRVNTTKDMLVNLDHNDIRIGQRGDPVKVKGLFANASRIFVTELAIERIDPEAGEKKPAAVVPEFTGGDVEDKTPRGVILKVN